MAMSRSDFNNALREAVSSEFTDIPTDESSINYTFSERFIKKMDKLIRSQKKVYYNFINTVSKRVAIIFLVVVTLFTTACSVKAIREPIVNFIKQVYEAFTHYSFEGETTDKITREYFIDEIPKGFEQTNKTKNDNIIVESSDDWVYKFVTEAQKRGIYTPKEMTLVSHEEYEEKWNRFCDQFFAEALEKQ